MFHRVDDWTSLGSSRYFRLASLLPLYPGAVQAALRMDLRKQEPAPITPPHPTSSLHPDSGGEPARVVNDLRVVAAMTAKPGFPGIKYRG